VTGTPSDRVVRAATRILPLGLLLLAGCIQSDGYPADLKYPSRKDPIVKKRPSDEPAYPIQPGQLEQSIVALLKVPDATVIDPIAPKFTDPKEARDYPKKRAQLVRELENCFGMPASPKVELPKDFAELELAQNAIRELFLGKDKLIHGSVLYRRHCLHCHGLAGDGRGPTGPWLNPSPRDYRQGLFKFISTATNVQGRKPRRADMYRIVHQGIESTSMPAFNLLSEAEVNDIISYVIHLSLRGEVEMNTIEDIINNSLEDIEGGDGDVASNVQAKLARFLGYWQKSNQEKGIIEPTTTARATNPDKGDFDASVKRGYAHFINEAGEASCIKCHRDFGRQVNFRYDSWGTLVRPMNLTDGVFRGGHRPIDLFYRIRGGIDPSGMPAAPGTLKDEDVWDVVNFLRVLPYPDRLPTEIKDQVYPRLRVASAHSEH
jgi:mono/diheme cytochrome c family protein